MAAAAASLLVTITLLLALAIAIAAKPVFEQNSPLTLPLIKRLSLTNYDVVEREVKSLNRRANDSEPKPYTTLAYFKTVQYTVPVRIGNGDDNIYYNLHLDSASSYTWVGARATNSSTSSRPYKSTNTSHQTTNKVKVTYSSSNFTVFEVFDRITMFPFVVNNRSINQSIGNASRVKLGSVGGGFEGVDGVFAIGPAALTIGTLSANRSASIPTITDNLYASGLIRENLVAVAFQPYNGTNITPGHTMQNGVLNWGGTDRSLYTGNIVYANITSIPVLKAHWAIDASITYGATKLPHITAGVVDTGTYFFFMASDAFKAYKDSTGADVDEKTGLLTITPAQFNNLQALSFNISGGAFTLIPDAQILPRTLNAIINGDTNSIYLIVRDIADAGGGLSTFILGITVLERFYCVFDTTNKRIGFANTPFTDANLNFNNISSSK